MQNINFTNCKTKANFYNYLNNNNNKNRFFFLRNVKIILLHVYLQIKNQRWKKLQPREVCYKRQSSLHLFLDNLHECSLYESRTRHCSQGWRHLVRCDTLFDKILDMAVGGIPDSAGFILVFFFMIIFTGVSSHRGMDTSPQAFHLIIFMLFEKSRMLVAKVLFDKACHSAKTRAT